MKLLKFLLFGFAFVATASVHAAATNRPNVLFILADDLGWGYPSCYGNTRFKTPALDRLAREGMLFTQYYQSAPVCSPSRCSLLTGRWPAEFAIHGHFAAAEENRRRDMSQFLDPSVATLPKLLKQAGYTTMHIGKWHLGKEPQSAAGLALYGFDEAHWVDARVGAAADEINLWSTKERPHAARILVDATIEGLRWASNKTFYCQLWLNDPHAPLAPTAEQMKPFQGQEPAGFTAPFAVYAATVTEMDRQIGRLLDALDKLGLAGNTIVIFSSDNGPEDIEIGNATWSGTGSAGPLRGRKRSLYEGGVRVPFIVRWPKGVPAGKVNNTTVVSGVDLLPTICELAGAHVPADVSSTLRGQSVVAALRGDSNFQRSKPLLWEWRFRIFNHPWNRSPMLAIRDGPWKLLLNPDHSRVELYNIPADLCEQDNVAKQHPKIVERLAKQALSWQKTLPPGMIEPAAGKNDYPTPKRPN